MKYFLPVGEVAEKARAILKERLDVGKRASRLLKRIGAETFSYKPANFEIVGFVFKKKPDESKWRFLKKAGIWVPKVKELKAEMASIRHDTKDQIYDLLKFGSGRGGVKIICEPNGIRLQQLGWNETKDGTLIFHTEDVSKLHGCKRISDIEAEKLIKFKK